MVESKEERQSSLEGRAEEFDLLTWIKAKQEELDRVYLEELLGSRSSSIRPCLIYHGRRINDKPIYEDGMSNPYY